MEFDEHLKVTQFSKQSFDGYKLADITGMSVDNQGNALFLNNKKGKSMISVIDPTGKVNNVNLDFAGIEPSDLKISDTKNDKLILAGTYIEGTEHVTGVFKSVLNKSTWAVNDIVKAPFPETIIKKLAIDDFAKSKSSKYGAYASKIYGNLVIHDDDIRYLIEFREMVTNGRV